MRPIQQTLNFVATAAAGVAASQTAATTATINGSLASAGAVVLPIAAPVTITSASDLSAFTFTVAGTAQNGAALTEAVTGPNNSTVTTTNSFKTITGITSNVTGVTSETITAGVTAAGVTGAQAWWPLDLYNPNQVTTISVTLVSGTANYDVQYTNENPFDSSITQQAVAHPAAALTGASASQTASTTTLMRAVRMKINSGTGSLRCTVTQQSTA